MAEQRPFQENDDQVVVDFPCPDCARPCQVNLDNNGLRHAVPYCMTYKVIVEQSNDGQTFLQCAYTGERYIGSGKFQKSGVSPLVISKAFGGAAALRVANCPKCFRLLRGPAAATTLKCECGHSLVFEPS